jgi:GNAT superfamily N-acetyltransferase
MTCCCTGPSAPASRPTSATVDDAIDGRLVTHGDARRQAADLNVVTAFALIPEINGGDRAGRTSFGSVEVAAAGIDVAFFNSVLALDPACRAQDVLAGVAWVEGRGLPASVQIADPADPSVDAALRSAGLGADPWPMPVMVLDPIPERPSAPRPADLDVRIGGADLHDDFHAALEAGPVFRELFGRRFMADDRIIAAVGYQAGIPVSCAASIRSGSTVGIYAVGTVERARRRGYGRAVTWAAIDAGRSAWDGTVAILQSSEAGVPVYRSLGFEFVGHYIEYARPKV